MVLTGTWFFSPNYSTAVCFFNFHMNKLKCNAKKIPKYSVANLDNMNIDSGKVFKFASIGKRNIKYLNCSPDIFIKII